MIARADSDISDIPPEVAAFERAAIALLRTVMLDGAAKRADGRKRDPWTTDPGHGPSLYRHLFRWRRGELVDADSGAHPLVHVAARALMQAHQELNRTP